MKKIFIKILSFLFILGTLSTSAIAIDKLHFVVPVVLEVDGMAVQEVLAKL